MCHFPGTTRFRLPRSSFAADWNLAHTAVGTVLNCAENRTRGSFPRGLPAQILHFIRYDGCKWI